MKTDLIFHQKMVLIWFLYWGRKKTHISSTFVETELFEPDPDILDVLMADDTNLN